MDRGVVGKVADPDRLAPQCATRMCGWLPSGTHQPCAGSLARALCSHEKAKKDGKIGKLRLRGATRELALRQAHSTCSWACWVFPRSQPGRAFHS